MPGKGKRVYDVPLTYEDYRLMPEGERYELIEWDLQMTPAPSPRHQLVVAAVEDALRHFVREHSLGTVLMAPVDVVLSETVVVQPDVLFIAQERLGLLQEECIRGAPDLVVEVLSPSSAKRDRLSKRRLYARFGVREYWMVDPIAKNVEVCLHDETDLRTVAVYPTGSTLASSVLPEFTLQTDTLFAG